MDNTKELPRVLSLCSGYGGLERGIERAIGKIRVLAHVEIEAFAVANLVNKMETGAMVSAPIWTDLKTFNAKIFRGQVDILTGGYPCQPFSAAGKRDGTDDPRHLWPYIRTIIMDCRPRTVFFENVEGHLSLGISEVLTDLEEMGYRVEVGIFSAAEVGATHQRKRVFILAESTSQRLEKPRFTGVRELREEEREGLDNRSKQQSDGEKLGNSPSDNKRRSSITAMHGEGVKAGGSSGDELADSGSEEFNRIPQTKKRSYNRETRNTGFEKWPARPGQPQHEWEEPRIVADTERKRPDRQESRVIRQSECKSWGDKTEDVKCRDEETNIEKGTGQTQSELGGTTNGPGHRMDRLRLLGNGVVPQTAEKAFITLSNKLQGRS